MQNSSVDLLFLGVYSVTVQFSDCLQFVSVISGHNQFMKMHFWRKLLWNIYLNWREKSITTALRLSFSFVHGFMPWWTQEKNTLLCCCPSLELQTAVFQFVWRSGLTLARLKWSCWPHFINWAVFIALPWSEENRASDEPLNLCRRSGAAGLSLLLTQPLIANWLWPWVSRRQSQSVR